MKKVYRIDKHCCLNSYIVIQQNERKEHSTCVFIIVNSGHPLVSSNKFLTKFYSFSSCSKLRVTTGNYEQL